MMVYFRLVTTTLSTCWSVFKDAPLSSWVQSDVLKVPDTRCATRCVTRCFTICAFKRFLLLLSLVQKYPGLVIFQINFIVKDQGGSIFKIILLDVDYTRMFELILGELVDEFICIGPSAHLVSPVSTVHEDWNGHFRWKGKSRWLILTWSNQSAQMAISKIFVLLNTWIVYFQLLTANHLHLAFAFTINFDRGRRCLYQSAIPLNKTSEFFCA